MEYFLIRKYFPPDFLPMIWIIFSVGFVLITLSWCMVLWWWVVAVTRERPERMPRISFWYLISTAATDHLAQPRRWNEYLQREVELMSVVHSSVGVEWSGGGDGEVPGLDTGTHWVHLSSVHPPPHTTTCHTGHQQRSNIRQHSYKNSQSKIIKISGQKQTRNH